jgi:hypothetical protein
MVEVPGSVWNRSGHGTKGWLKSPSNPPQIFIAARAVVSIHILVGLCG